jgi:hypothetical protein
MFTHTKQPLLWAPRSQQQQSRPQEPLLSSLGAGHHGHVTNNSGSGLKSRYRFLLWALGAEHHGLVTNSSSSSLPQLSSRHQGHVTNNSGSGLKRRYRFLLWALGTTVSSPTATAGAARCRSSPPFWAQRPRQ